MRALLGIVLVAVLIVGLMLLLPAPVDPVSWEPDPDPGLTGLFAPNDKLANVPRLLEGVGTGPEDVACGADGVRYTGFADGRIVRLNADGSHTEIVNTGGRPLGMQLDANGRLIVVDALHGLIAVSGAGEIEVLADTVNGKKILFADDLDIAADGTVWFSDASSRHGYRTSMYNFIEARRTGSLLSYHPDTGETRVHIDGLFFANGVALGPDDEYVLVNETGTGRIHRLWLQGDKAGQQDIFASSLPGTPDNLSFNGSDTFWVAMPGLRAGLDAAADKPLVRKLLSRLPYAALADGGGKFTMVIGLSLDGQVKHNLQDTGAGFHMITSANECEGALYLGSLAMKAIGRYPLVP